MIYINSKNKLKINKDNTYILIDFDKTITCCESADSWDAVANKNIVPEALRKE